MQRRSKPTWVEVRGRRHRCAYPRQRPKPDGGNASAVPFTRARPRAARGETPNLELWINGGSRASLRVYESQRELVQDDVVPFCRPPLTHRRCCPRLLAPVSGSCEGMIKVAAGVGVRAYPKRAKPLPMQRSRQQPRSMQLSTEAWTAQNRAPWSNPSRSPPLL